MRETAIIILILFINYPVFPEDFDNKGFKQDVFNFSDYECNSKSCQSRDKEGPPKVGETIVISIFPGIVFHGMGHFYIGEKKTGFILFGIGLISEIGYFLWLDEWLGATVCKREYTSSSFLFPSSIKERCYGILTPTLFFGSWFYDVIAAPIKASNMRKEYEKKKENVLKPELKLMPLTDKALQLSRGEISFQSSYYEVQNASADLNGGMILFTWRW